LRGIQIMFETCRKNETLKLQAALFERSALRTLFNKPCDGMQGIGQYRTAAPGWFA